MKTDNDLRNNLKSIRTRLGMSQQELASLAGVTRQAISGVESGQCTPSVATTIRLAKALGCKVEDLFWLEQDLPQVQAVLAKSIPCSQQQRVSLARIGGQWIAYPLVGNDAFRMEMISADAQIDSQTDTNTCLVRLLDDIDRFENTVVIAGCAPVLSLWARATERWYPQLRVQYKFANSMAALESLCRGETHIAGMHLYDSQTGEHNIPFVREVLAGKEAVLITLGIWEEGLLVQSGNPMQITTVTDLVEAKAKIINREKGAGIRLLLERKLQEEQLPCDSVKGFDSIARSHHSVADAVVSGFADAGISTASVATAFGLEFIPWHSSRYDLVILKEYLQEPPVQQLLNTLERRSVHSQLEIIGGCDTSKTGDLVATI
ncbi:MAG: helix-turn-helix domain-containing protein [Brasilonema angustatum HA4187-MV1]|jgi:molybdate-binding protein/DNA-binding XRE family transcriptional regulator|nr:helix-turn-helix domain-containing protein [Brasilonema angustatum HA4187-MV1]